MKSCFALFSALVATPACATGPSYITNCGALSFDIRGQHALVLACDNGYFGSLIELQRDNGKYVGTLLETIRENAFSAPVKAELYGHEVIGLYFGRRFPIEPRLECVAGTDIGFGPGPAVLCAPSKSWEPPP